MSLLDTLRKHLAPDLLSQVQDQLGDDFDYDLVPRTRLNTVIKQRNTLRDQLAGGSPPAKKNSEGSTDGIEDFGVDLEALKQQYQQSADEQIAAVKLEYAAINMLRAAKVRDPEMVWSSNAINKANLKMSEDGRTVEGLADLITQLQKDKGHLFEAAEPPVPPGTGKEGGDDIFKGVATKEDFLKLDADAQYEFKQKNPEVFKSFMNA